MNLVELIEQTEYDAMFSELQVCQEMMETYQKASSMSEYLGQEIIEEGVNFDKPGSQSSAQEQNTPSSKSESGGILSKVKEGVVKAFEAFINALKKIGREISKWFSKFKNAKFLSFLKKKDKCAEVGEYLKDAVGDDVVAESYMMEATFDDLVDAGKGLLKEGKKKYDDIVDQTTDAIGTAVDTGKAAVEKADDAITNTAKRYRWSQAAGGDLPIENKNAIRDYHVADEKARIGNARKSRISYQTSQSHANDEQARLQQSALRYAANTGAGIGVSKFPTGMMIGIGVAAAILICAAVFIAVSKMNNPTLPSAQQIVMVGNALTEDCKSCVSALNAQWTGMINPKINNHISKETNAIVRKLENWRAKAEKNEISLSGKLPTSKLTTQQANILAEAVIFMTELDENKFNKMLSELTDAATKLKNALKKNGSETDKISKSIQKLATSCVTFTTTIAAVQKIGGDMVKNMEGSLGAVEKIVEKKQRKRA